jgi:hypothetical protein
VIRARATATAAARPRTTASPTAPTPTPTSGYPSCGGLCTEETCERSFRCETGAGGGLQDITCGACPVTPVPPGPPVARAGVPLCGVVNEVMYFGSLCSKASEGLTIQDYAWTFGDGGMGHGVVVEHTYAAPGTYPISLVVTDSAGVQSQPSYSSARAWTKPHGALFTDTMPTLKYVAPAHPQSPQGTVLPAAAAGTVVECANWVPEVRVVLKSSSNDVLSSSGIILGKGNHVQYMGSVGVPIPVEGAVLKMTTTYFVNYENRRRSVKAIDSVCTFKAATSRFACTHTTRVLP